MSNADAFHDQDDRARHERIKAPRPYRFGAKRPIEGLPGTLPDPVKAYLDVLPEGRVVGFPLAPLDRTGVPVWFVALFLDDPFFVGAMPSGIGYGATDDEALIGAVAEIAENLMPSLAVLPRAKERASYTDLVRVYGAKSVADPLTLCLPAGSPVGRDTVLEWTPSVRHATGEIVLMPLDVAATDYFELSEGYKPFTNLITNGLGAGPDVPFALGHGVLELLQRDGNGLLFRALDQGVMLDLEGIGPENAAMLARLKELGIRALPKFATDQFGLTNLYVVGYDEDPARTPAPIALSACGEACDPDRERALRKALLEFQAARVRKTFGHGPLDMAATVTPPGYVDAFIQKALPSLDLEESRALQAMLEWIEMPAADLRGVLADTVYSERSTKSFAELPSTPAADGHARGKIACDRLLEAGFDVLYVDCTPRGGVGVVKAIVPGLEVETMSYYRIGERNTKKLLDRDHPLITFGTESETLRPVRLTPEALERFGGQPLFDVALAERIVGRHYPLYREPESHHAPFRLAQRKGEGGVTLRFAYNTNGAANHRLDDALHLIKAAGYDGVALTLDIHHLDPFAETWAAEAGRVASLLEKLELTCVIETGARFLLDPSAKHEPTLVTADAAGRARRVGFLKRAIEIGAMLSAEAVSFWAGVPKPGVDHGEARRWLVEGLHEVAAFAAESGIVPCLEPEPGMLIETLDDYAALDVPGLKLALDTGHCLVTGEREPAAAVREFADRIGTVAIEDMKRGSHIHLPFGEGDMDVPGVLEALEAVGFGKLICVELSRESHRADVMIPQALDYLRGCRRPGPVLAGEQETRRQWQ